MAPAERTAPMATAVPMESVVPPPWSDAMVHVSISALMRKTAVLVIFHAASAHVLTAPAPAPASLSRHVPVSASIWIVIRNIAAHATMLAIQAVNVLAADVSPAARSRYSWVSPEVAARSTQPANWRGFRSHSESQTMVRGTCSSPTTLAFVRLRFPRETSPPSLEILFLEPATRAALSMESASRGACKAPRALRFLTA